MAVRYTLIGFDGDKNPVTMADVTVEEAKVIASAKGLGGFTLAPQRMLAADSPSFRTYERDDDGNYRQSRMRWWVGKYLMTLKDDE